MKPIFYYIRGTKSNTPAITVCLVRDDDKNYFFRGVAICSAQDNPFRTWEFNDELHQPGGKDWASRRVCRAVRILRKKQIINSDQINFESCKIKASMEKFGWTKEQLGFTYKTSAVSFEGLTEFERKLVAKI